MAITRCTATHDYGTTCTSQEVTYDGHVLGTYERNGYDDSDFVAVVWDTEKQAIVPITYGTTRGWTYHNGATKDAPLGILVQARAWLYEKLLPVMIGRAKRDVVEGSTVRSLTTRGKNKGLTGTVTRIVPNEYRYDAWRVRIVTDEGEVRWMDESRVEVTDTHLLAQARERAEDAAMYGSIARTYHAYLG